MTNFVVCTSLVGGLRANIVEHVCARDVYKTSTWRLITMRILDVLVLLQETRNGTLAHLIHLLRH